MFAATEKLCSLRKHSGKARSTRGTRRLDEEDPKTGAGSPVLEEDGLEGVLGLQDLAMQGQ